MKVFHYVNLTGINTLTVRASIYIRSESTLAVHLTDGWACYCHVLIQNIEINHFYWLISKLENEILKIKFNLVKNHFVNATRIQKSKKQLKMIII